MGLGGNLYTTMFVRLMLSACRWCGIRRGKKQFLYIGERKMGERVEVEEWNLLLSHVEFTRGIVCFAKSNLNLLSISLLRKKLGLMIKSSIMLMQYLH